MAHEIINNLSGVILSSSLQRIDIAADGAYADVQLTAASGSVLLAERYYAFENVVRIYDLASLIEAEMRTAGQSYAEFTLNVFADDTQHNCVSRVLRVLYCDRLAVCSDVSLFLRENFLTSFSTRRLPVGAAITLPFLLNVGESAYARVECRSRHAATDTLVSHSFGIGSTARVIAAGIYEVSVCYADLLADAESYFDCPLSEIESLTFTVSVGQRSVTCYFDRALHRDDTFYFRNCFNAVDSVCLPCLTTAKTDVERSTAIINGQSRIYNQSATKTYEVEAGPLTSDEAEGIDQLLTSHWAARMAPDLGGDVLTPILITEQTCEIANAEDKLNSVKFTWRYADNRPIFRMSVSPNIFSQQFSPKFS